MKKLILAMLLFIVSCGPNIGSDERFVIKSKHGSDFKIQVITIQDTNTGQEYLFVKKGFAGGVCSLEKD